MSDSTYMAFAVKDCTLITRMAGVKEALNLRELEERVKNCPDESLFHHFCETVIRPTFDYPDYTNDFALWAGAELRDKKLAERLSLINPYKCASFDELRQQLMDILQERLGEIDHIPWAPKGRAFQFMQAATVVFDTGIVLETAGDLCTKISDLSLGSIYYHFVEARRRTESHVDDFTAWLLETGENVQDLTASLQMIDFYFMTLAELRSTLIAITSNFMKNYQYGKNITKL